MSFQEAEKGNDQLSGLTKNHLIDALSDDTYTINPNQPFENLNEDSLISTLGEAGDGIASRQSLLTHLTEFDVKEIKFRTLAFSRQHRQEGPLIDKNEPITVGRVTTLNAIVNGVLESAIHLGLKAAQIIVEEAVMNAPKDSLNWQKKLLKNKKLGKYQMWVYPTSSKLPYERVGETRNQVEDSLGLGHYRSEPGSVVTWEHTVEIEQTVYRPTAWDSDLNPFWRHGGKTFRLDSNEYGEDEFIHDPITGDKLKKPIVELH